MGTSDSDMLLRGRYRLERKLHEGRGSTTWVASDFETGSPCVVKELSVGRVVRGATESVSYDPDDFTKLVELFERESRVLSHLSHRGVPRFVEHFSVVTPEDTRLYLVQEFIDGRTLRSLVDEGRHFTEAEAIDICEQVASILEYLHTRSPALIHRDIKPDNVLVGSDGSVYLVDFGAVRNTTPADDLDGQTIVGTYGYMPHEQYEARAVPASDIYSLGMTLVFLLSHEAPTKIARTGMRLDFRKHVNVSERFAAVIDRMIQPDPGNRYETAADLLAALGEDGSGARAARPDGDPKAQAKLLGSITVAVALVFAGAFAVSVNNQDDVTPNRNAPTLPVGGARPPAPLSPPSGVEPVRAVDGVLTVDILDDFRYVPVGYPMGRTVSITEIGGLSEEPSEDLTLPRGIAGASTFYGEFPLGNSADRYIAYALTQDDRRWSLRVDKNNNEDLTDDGPPIFPNGTERSLTTDLAVEVDIVSEDGEVRRRPYGLWVHFSRMADGTPFKARIQAQHHYYGVIGLGDALYETTAFEYNDQDGL